MWHTVRRKRHSVGLSRSPEEVHSCTVCALVYMYSGLCHILLCRCETTPDRWALMYTHRVSPSSHLYSRTNATNGDRHAGDSYRWGPRGANQVWPWQAQPDSGCQLSCMQSTSLPTRCPRTSEPKQQITGPRTSAGNSVGCIITLYGNTFWEFYIYFTRFVLP